MTLMYVYESIYALTAPTDDVCDHDNFKIQGHCVTPMLFDFAKEVLSLRDYKEVRFYCPFQTKKFHSAQTLYGVFPGNVIVDFYISAIRGKFEFTTEKIIKPRIRNNSHKKRTKESVNLTTILRYMSKNVPSPDPSDVLNRLSRDYKAVASSRSAAMTNSLNEAVLTLTTKMTNGYSGNRELLNELLHLYKTGYQFQHKSVQTAMDKIVSIMAEQEEQGGADLYDTVAVLPKIPGINRTLVRYYQDVDYNSVENHGSSRVLAIEELPEETLRGVMILQAVDNGTLIEGVGYKQSDNLFFVHSRCLKDDG